MTAGGAFADHVVGVRTLAGARVGAVQVLAPEQELDGVVAGGDVGLGAAQFVQLGEFLAGDFGDVDLVFADLDLGVGDDVGLGGRVALGLGGAVGDVVDQAFVQRPGVELAFPVVDHGVAEAEHLGLHVRHAGGQPGFAGGVQGVGAGVGEQRVDRGLQGLAGGGGVVEDVVGEVGVVGDHGLGGGLVDLAAGRVGRGAGGCWSGRRRRLGGRGFVVAATGEGDGNGQQAGGGQRHTNHGEVLCVE
ncbi:hypothetical protein D9M69_476810 [compost metagenome]